jgi:hypothetical protein
MTTVSGGFGDEPAPPPIKIKQPPGTTLPNDAVPKFTGNWDNLTVFNPTKWDNLHQAVRRIQAGPEQAMILDLMNEVISLERSGGVTEPATVSSPTGGDNLELALIKALAGKILDCEHGSTLLSTVASIMEEL